VIQKEVEQENKVKEEIRKEKERSQKILEAKGVDFEL